MKVQDSRPTLEQINNSLQCRSNNYSGEAQRFTMVKVKNLQPTFMQVKDLWPTEDCKSMIHRRANQRFTVAYVNNLGQSKSKIYSSTTQAFMVNFGVDWRFTTTKKLHIEDLRQFKWKIHGIEGQIVTANISTDPMFTAVKLRIYSQHWHHCYKLYVGNEKEGQRFKYYNLMIWC